MIGQYQTVKLPLLNSYYYRGGVVFRLMINISVWSKGKLRTTLNNKLLW